MSTAALVVLQDRQRCVDLFAPRHLDRLALRGVSEAGSPALVILATRFGALELAPATRVSTPAAILLSP